MKIVLAPSNQDNNLYSYGGTNEMQQTRRISNAVSDYLKGYEVDVLNWLPPEWGFEERVKRANQLMVDLFLSIHTNAGGGRGVETYIGLDGSGRRIGEAMNREISALGVPNRGIKQRKSATYNGNFYYEIREAKMEAVMVECAFHDNAAEAKWIIENAERIGHAIGRALVTTYALKPKAAPTPKPEPDDWTTRMRKSLVDTAIMSDKDWDQPATKDQIGSWLYTAMLKGYFK